MFKNSIRNKLTGLMLGISLLIIVVTWIFAIILVKPTYDNMIQSEINAVLQITMNQLDSSNGVITDELLNMVRSAINVDMCIGISNKDGTDLLIVERVGDNCRVYMPDQGYNELLYNDVFSLFAVQNGKMREDIVESGKLLQTITDEHMNRRMVAGEYWNGQYVVIVSASLEKVDKVVGVVRAQLKPIMFITVVVALIMSAILSNWFVRPLMLLSNATKDIAKGNYDVKFEDTSDSNDELAQLTKDFITMAGEIKSSQNFQKELIANVSHDLRTPLTIIKGYAESIRDITGENKEIREQQLNTIIDETDRLSKMVNTVMEYSKLSQGNYKLSIVQYNIADMCKDVVEVYSIKAEKEHKTISYNGPDTVYVMSDATLVERALHNFVSNALAHTKENDYITLNVSVLDNGKVKISVVDTGEGISEQDQEHLFDRYYRTRKSEGKQGSGLGLAIVKSIMDTHGFEYGVNSQLGKGSEFWFVM